MPPTIPDPADIKAAVDVALAEDIGTGDFTTKAVIPADTRLNLIMATRQDIVVAGLPVALEVFRRLDPDAVITVETNDGAKIPAATEIARVEGQAEALLAEVRGLKKQVEVTNRGLTGKSVIDIKGIEFGNYHALVIGIDEYKHLPKLETAVRDAKAVAQVLEKDYGFKVRLLVNPDRLGIIDAFDEYRESLGGKDNLLIYYAGHGWLDEDADRGYWLPADAQ